MASWGIDVSTIHWSPTSFLILPLCFSRSLKWYQNGCSLTLSKSPKDRTRDAVRIQSAVRRFLVRNRRFHLLAKVRKNMKTYEKTLSGKTSFIVSIVWMWHYKWLFHPQPYKHDSVTWLGDHDSETMETLAALRSRGAPLWMVLLLEFSEWPPSWDLFQQSNALLEHAKLTNRPNILFHHKSHIIYIFPALLDNFGQWPFGFLTALCFVLKKTMGRGFSRSEYGDEHVQSCSGRQNVYQTCCFRASVGENPHELIWRNETFFQCFWKCFFDEQTPFLESCRESKYIKV